MDYRFNILTRFYIKSGMIVIKMPLSDKNLELEYKSELYDFFVYLEENIYISKDIALSYGVNENLLNILLKIGVLQDCIFNSGIEAFHFDRIMGNPSRLLQKVDNNEIYDKLENGLDGLVDSTETHELDNSNLNKFTLESDVFSLLKSTRLTSKNSSESNFSEIFSIIRFIFEPHKDIEYFGMKKKFFKYGSGGGLNSIFPLIISKEDFVYIFDKFNNKLYKKHVNNIYNEYIEKGLVECDTNFNSYNYFILLFSHTDLVFKKYGNRGYRLLHLECGEISFMFRLLSGKFNKPHLEIQGFYEDKIYDMISKAHIFTNLDDILLLHTIAISE